MSVFLEQHSIFTTRKITKVQKRARENGVPYHGSTYKSKYLKEQSLCVSRRLTPQAPSLPNRIMTLIEWGNDPKPTN